MRAFPSLVAALLLTAAFAGCIGGKDGEEPGAKLDPTNLPGGGTGTGIGAGAGGALTVLSALNATLTLDAPAWVQTGTEVPVSLSAPANAKGAITYAWAIGALPGATEVTAVKMDTGSNGSAAYIQPGASKTLTYATAGVYRMHCHPHPAMLHNVTVIDGYAGPKNVEVAITDGATPKESRFVPENIVIGAGTVVTYKNVGQQPHTASAMGTQEPAPKALPLKAANGTIKVESEGWQRIVAVYVDSEGRLGITEKPIYATATLPAFETATYEFEFTHGAAPLAGTAAAPTAQTESILLEQAGVVTINYTFTDGPGGVAPEANQAEVEIHFTKDGETQDTFTSAGGTGTTGGKAIAGAYTLSVLPTNGVEISGTIVIDVVYELVPPPAPPAPPPADGQGAHAH